jgi:primosomal protein N' (replication factor Y)
VGNGSRVGLVFAPDGGEPDYGGELRQIEALVDETPLLPGFMAPLIRWFSETYLCGAGAAMKTLLPASFLKGEALGRAYRGEIKKTPAEKTPYSDSFIYEPVDSLRWERYAELSSDGLPSLICFPQYETAKLFAEYLGERAALFPRGGAKAEWREWGRLLSGEGPKVVVGGQTAATAPLPGLVRIIVEDESNNAWRTVRPPVFNVRSLLSKRARIEGASLVLGGRMPSSRVYRMMAETDNLGLEPCSSREGGKSFVFVDLKLAYSPSVKGVRDTLAVSEPLVRETESAIERGLWALWILDRRGYAGEIICDECGRSLRCGRCGGAMRWEASANRLSCVSCGAPESIPESCPNCDGKLLMAKRPGLEALLHLARAAINGPVSVLSLEDEDKNSLCSALEAQSGLIIGTRAALALCDRAKVGMVGWIDADGEARSQEYDARARAFGLVWESRWRGIEPLGRRVLLQTRRPGRDWQKGLETDRPGLPGWRVFWRADIRERRELSMPPFLSLVKIEANKSDIPAMSDRFDEASFEYWLPDDSDARDSSKATIWLRTNSVKALRNALTPFFTIKRAKRGYPSITIRHE